MISHLRAAFHDPHARSYRIVQGFIWVLIVVAITLTVLELLQLDWLPPTQVLRRVDQFVLGLFGIELFLRVLTYRPPALDLYVLSRPQRLRAHLVGRLRFLLEPANLLDLITVVAVYPSLRGLRALRLAQLTRTLPFFQRNSLFAHLKAAFQDNAFLWAFAFSFLLAETVIGGITLYLTEAGGNDQISTIGDGLWWALVTLTTVGYGDITPNQPLGRIWAAILMVAGMFTLALFSGIVARTLLDTVLRLREEPLRMTFLSNHIVICGYDPSSRDLLDALLRELSTDPQEVVIFGPGERPEGVPASFRWVTGDPTKEIDLPKAALSSAEMVILLGNRRLNPQQADATTLLTAFTIRSAMTKGTMKRRKPLYMVTEIMDDENVEHARSAGADEVVCSNQVGYALLAHAIAEPGTGDVMSTLVSAGDQSVFVGSNPLGKMTHFGEVAAHVKQAHHALLIGIRRPGGDKLNPQDDLAVHPTDKLIYLAPKAVLPRA